MLIDKYGRTVNYLRISVIDHCNLRCLYCMPLRGLSYAPSNTLLSASEIGTVVRAAARLGFTKVRLTGGEPTLRSDLPAIVAQVAANDEITDVALTTNGILLPPMLDDLVAAGLNRVNLHIDTLDPERFKHLMRFGTLAEAWAGLEAVIRVGLSPIKINVVVVRDHNDTDVVDFARLTLTHDWHVRFIELMPLGGGECARVALSQFVPSSESRDRIQAALGPLTPLPRRNQSDESCNYRLPGAPGVIGFISPVSEPYCGDCNRMRLTADGKLHLCLLQDHEIDLRPALRNGNGRLTELIRQAVDAKPSGHRLDDGVSTEQRNMYQIGG